MTNHVTPPIPFTEYAVEPNIFLFVKPPRLERAKASNLPCFATFVRGIRADYDAVKAAFTLEWSNGPVEGHVNRLKFIKRQGYGRAKFDLLKRRVLPLPS